MNMNKAMFFAAFAVFVAFPAMAETQKETVYRADIWVDPDGCQHWIIDTGFEGFMSQRLDRAGKPVCNQPLTLNCASGAATSLNAKGEPSCQ
jgi:hypothetical protein